ncbi:MAG: hypothetical protein JO202_03720 [Ktedonobacteraceae bacterium]|nr:hypothetical protein [Ktedonobacteraceae bacterium]
MSVENKNLGKNGSRTLNRPGALMFISCSNNEATMGRHHRFLMPDSVLMDSEYY